jgi:hypothetical protein
VLAAFFAAGPAVGAPLVTAQALSTTFPPYVGQANGRQETVTVQVQLQNDAKGQSTAAGPSAELRRFEMSSSQPMRDQAAQQRVVHERADAPRVHSGNALFDALFAMAIDDARLNSVDEIRDDAYNGGAPIACRCFQTGEFWRYVWTRDLSYAAHLGLAWLDPQRTVASLRFKTSGWRQGVPAVAGLPAGSLQIIQDTGSGGSWPVSTDRVSWAWGAEAVLNVLSGADRSAFAAHAYAALQGTLEADRLAAFDSVSGLYGGEQSFLDWRTQSYAPWIVNNLARMAGSRSLSTNVSHFQALRLAARLAAETGKAGEAQRYGAWAEALKQTIDRTFWLPDAQQYASLTSDDPHPIALHKYDLLGTALAVIAGVASPERAAASLARYPHAPFGAPVIAPQQPGVPVYHNRAIWPFVSAYALRAAAQMHNPAVASHAFESLQRAAALNLSNMENLEWLTATPRFDDGPVINSRRQLWSVGAYISAVSESVFGLHFEATGIRVAPFLTTEMRRALGDGEHATLSNIAYRGRLLTVSLKLPPSTADTLPTAYFPVSKITLNGRVSTGPITAAQLSQASNLVEIEFGPGTPGDARLALVPAINPLSHDDARVFAPAVPEHLTATASATGSGVLLNFEPPRGANSGVAGPEEPADLVYNIYRDGQRVASAWPGLSWTDAAPLRAASHQYAVEAVHLASGHHSHTSEPVRFDGTLPQRVQLGETFTRTQSGPVGLELLHDNHAFEIGTGVTNAVKVLRVLDERGREVARGVVQMPHIEAVGDSHPQRASTLLRLVLPAGRYQAELLDFFNMSYLQSNASYSGPGGRRGPLNEARIGGVQIVTLPPGP